MRENDIDLAPDQFGRNLSETLAAALRPANLNRDVATFHPTEFAQPLHECGEPFTLDQGRGGAQESDGRQLAGLLSERRERPRRRAAEQRDELAPLHSITLSARRSSVEGTARPMAAAVLRLTTSSKIAGCSTGRSAGEVPRRTLTSSRAICRYIRVRRAP